MSEENVTAEPEATTAPAADAKPVTPADAKPHTPSGKVAAIREAQPDLTGLADALKDMEPAAAKARKEAANYRERLRATEEERDLLASQLAHARRPLLKNTASFGRVLDSAKADAIAMIADDDLGGLFTEDGSPDEERISAAVSDIIEAKPYMEHKKYGVPEAEALRSVGRKAENPEGVFDPNAGRDPLRLALHR